MIKAEHPELPVVMISGHGNIETAVAAIKQGAYDFIEKPFKADRLVLVADRALETSRLKREVKELKHLAPHPCQLVGSSVAMLHLRQNIERVAPTNSRILIVGPSGAGKELTARTIHAMSSRAAAPFVVINAAAITPERMEIELFGIEGADGAQPGVPGAQDRRARGGPWRHACSSTRSATCRARPRTRSCACWSTRPSCAPAARTKVEVNVRIITSTTRNLEEEIASRTLPRGPLSPALGGADPGAAADRAARGRGRAGRPFHGPDFAGDRAAQTPDRRRRHGGPADA